MGTFKMNGCRHDYLKMAPLPFSAAAERIFCTRRRSRWLCVGYVSVVLNDVAFVMNIQVFYVMCYYIPTELVFMIQLSNRR